MQKKWVISLGGSRIAPQNQKIDHKFINKFKDLIEKHPKQRFVVVTGGGATARQYIQALKTLGKKTKAQSLIGIKITRLHAGFLARIFGKKANDPTKPPQNMKKVKNLLKQNQIVFCGALRYNPKQTSDGTAASLAAYLNCPFINITNIKGLYTHNPRTNKDAKFIKKITWKKLNKMAGKIKFKAGQHFVIDQDAADTIMDEKIPTYIVGSLEDVDKIFQGKKDFKGTFVCG